MWAETVSWRQKSGLHDFNKHFVLQEHNTTQIEIFYFALFGCFSKPYHHLGELYH